MTSVQHWEWMKRRGISRKTMAWIIDQNDLGIPISMIIARLVNRRLAERKRGRVGRINFPLSISGMWGIIQRHRRFLEAEKTRNKP